MTGPIVNTCEVCRVGDWVCFTREQRQVIGRVEYVEQSKYGSRKYYAHTSVGTVAVDEILEVRTC